MTVVEKRLRGLRFDADRRDSRFRQSTEQPPRQRPSFETDTFKPPCGIAKNSEKVFGVTYHLHFTANPARLVDDAYGRFFDRQMSGCGARTAAESLKAVFEVVGCGREVRSRNRSWRCSTRKSLCLSSWSAKPAPFWAGSRTTVNSPNSSWTLGSRRRRPGAPRLSTCSAAAWKTRDASARRRSTKRCSAKTSRPREVNRWGRFGISSPACWRSKARPSNPWSPMVSKFWRRRL